MYLTKKHLSRRTLLKAGGASIALPLLDAMIPAATALENTAAAAKPRMGFIYFPHGAVMDRWSPKQTGTDFELPQILSPLKDFKQHMTIVSGLRNKPAESPDPHGITAGTWLRCVAPKGTDDPNDGTSVDQVAAQHLGQDTAFPSLELATAQGGTNNGSFSTTIAFRTPTQPLPMEPNPRNLFYRLFGQGDTAEEREAIVKETGSLLDLVSDNAAALKRKLGAADRAVMGDYLESVREVERQVQTLKDQDFSSLDLPDAPVGIPDTFEAHLNMMFDLWALAWQADLTRVTSFMMDREVSMRTYNNIGISDAFHPLSHHQNLPEKLDKLARVQSWHTKVFSRFVKKLADMRDGDGTMLDHSMVLFGSNMSNSNLHNNDPLPSVIMGHAYGRIKGGQHLKYPQDTPQANLMLTMLDRAQIHADHHGDSTGVFAEV